MTGCIVQVWFETDHELAPKKPLFKMIETEFEDFATFCEFVEADRFIGGAILWTRKNPDGHQVINRRQPCGFRGSAVMRCELPTWKFVEEKEPA